MVLFPNLKFNPCSKKSVMMAVPNRLMLSAELFEMYHGPYNEKEFQITMKCLTDCFSEIAP
jgi:hypothetical protein